MRVVALGADQDHPFILPAADPFAMAAEIPVLLTVCMAGTANAVRLLEIDFLITGGAQKIHVIAIVTGQAPEPVAAMINFTDMPRLQSARFRIGIPFLVATGTVLEFQFSITWLQGEAGGLGVELSSLARISLPGTNDAGCGDCQNHRQQTQHYTAPFMYYPRYYSG